MCFLEKHHSRPEKIVRVGEVSHQDGFTLKGLGLVILGLKENPPILPDTRDRILGTELPAIVISLGRLFIGSATSLREC
jgi:hypothetical protein